MPEHKPFHLKHVGFAGRFKGGAKPLKDLVYLADGAPVDNIAIFTDYIVVGEGGEKTQAYKKVAYGIERGRIITLTPNQLIDIAQGRLAPPQPKPVEVPTRIISESPEAAEYQRQSELFLWQAKRDMYVERYGIPVADNVRVKMNVRVAKAMQKVFEADIVSVRDNPEYLDRAAEHLSSKWDIPRVVYQDCLANSVTDRKPPSLLVSSRQQHRYYYRLLWAAHQRLHQPPGPVAVAVCAVCRRDLARAWTRSEDA